MKLFFTFTIVFLLKTTLISQVKILKNVPEFEKRGSNQYRIKDSQLTHDIGNKTKIIGGLKINHNSNSYNQRTIDFIDKNSIKVYHIGQTYSRDQIKKQHRGILDIIDSLKISIADSTFQLKHLIKESLMSFNINAELKEEITHYLTQDLMRYIDYKITEIVKLQEEKLEYNIINGILNDDNFLSKLKISLKE